MTLTGTLQWQQSRSINKSLQQSRNYQLASPALVNWQDRYIKYYHCYYIVVVVVVVVVKHYITNYRRQRSYDL